MQKFFLTSPIYYVNDIAHIGHAYTTMLCDMLKKYYEIRGFSVKFLTGTDEHGQKIEQSAKAKGQSPRDYADFISGRFRNLWDSFGIDYDIFVRTTDENHCKAVQYAFKKMLDKGDIYQGSYEGHYCISCESFFTKTQLINNECCPDCGKKTQIVKEESYFFALSKYQDKLLAFYESHPHFIEPHFRQNEVTSFIKSGLNDLSITRTSFEWGIPLLESKGKKYVAYVWLDALLSYISPLGFGSDEKLMAYWENATHIVGKDILRFHAVYWLAFLLSLELPLPQHIYVHGWWLQEGAKMSKSLGNVINPIELAKAYGIEPLRFFLMREMPFGQDGDFSQKAFIERINAELSNDVGNLLNRLIGMSEKYCDLNIDSSQVKAFYAAELAQCEAHFSNANDKMQTMQPSKYIEELWKAFGVANNAISKYAPWQMIKDKKNDEVIALLALVANILAKSALLLYPIMPKAAKTMASALGVEINAQSFERLITQKELLPKMTIHKIAPLFPRIERDSKDSQKQIESSADSKANTESLVDIKDFHKLDLRVGTVLECEKMPKSEKMLKLLIDLGESKPRQILSGIAKFYAPETLIGKQVCVIANLKSAKLMGEISEGMILASEDANGLSLLGINPPRENGSKIS